MAQDESAGGGLFSKVFQFVRHPATPWNQLDAPGAAEDPALTREALREMAVRRKRNDFVRRREFSVLRKLRSSTGRVAQAAEAVRQSFFQSSFSSNSDERALTLRKIDEIEAQMSMQWWTTKEGATMAPLSGAPSQPGLSGSTSPHAGRRTPEAADGPETYARGDTTLPTTQLPPDSEAPLTRYGHAAGFSASQLFAVEVAELMHDPELEEAAIRFANGDSTGAEAALQEALAAGGPRHGHQETWLALFDLYRATGQQEAFEHTALDFAQQFGRSAPQWFSLPDQIGRMAAAAPRGAAAGSGTQRRADWTAPALLDARAAHGLASASALSDTVRLDWSALAAIAPDAAPPLLALLAHWRGQALHLECIAANRLADALQAATPSGQPETDAVWWRLRMETCRVMHQPEEFELAALDYCVTYEVSPPSWEPVACRFTALAAAGEAVGLVESAAADSTLWGDSLLRQPDTLAFQGEGASGDAVSVVLAGLVLGDAPPVLQQLDARWTGADTMLIDCSRLVRMDFAAAGALLNWVSGHRAALRTVQFTRVHRVLAPFFSVIGIADIASVSSAPD
jgi:ABC-type transporter Mla MlaB component